jgi:transposase-like protein
MTELKVPKSLQEAILYYSSEVVCVEFLSQLFWNGQEKTCIACGSTAVYGMRTRPKFKCRDCKKQFSLKSNTVMANSPLPITKWVPAIWMVINCKNGISSCEMARALNVTQKTAWHMNHRIREAIANITGVKLSGITEADETYIGGSDTNRHEDKKIGRDGKAIVFGAVQRGGKVTAKVIDSADTETLHFAVRNAIEKGSTLFTDSADGYNTAKHYAKHDTVNHSAKEYARYVKGGETIHTNTIENYWSLVKRALKGTYIHVEPFHLDRYLQEQGFRYDNRENNDSGRFIVAASLLFGKRLTYAELTGKNQ